jgi:hypothetical protein
VQMEEARSSCIGSTNGVVGISLKLCESVFLVKLNANRVLVG